MRSRRLWWSVGAAVVVAAGAISCVAMSTPTLPLHFWIRDGDGPTRLHRAPDGEEVAHWTAEWFSGQLGVARQATLGDRVRSIVGLSKLPLAAAGFEMSDGASLPRGWREFIVIRTDDGWLPVGSPDPSLAGRWSCSEPFPRVMDLRADGTMERGPSDGRWGRSDDLVVIDTNPVGIANGAKPTEAFLLSRDSRAIRDILGHVWCKSE